MATIATHELTGLHDNLAHTPDGHHHKETFLTKYVFSQDHKMVAKQVLITGMVMGVIGMGLSLLFRIQLAYPDQTLPFLEALRGRVADSERIGASCYLAQVTIHGPILGILH